jgi:hypothetical protein
MDADKFEIIFRRIRHRRLSVVIGGKKIQILILFWSFLWVGRDFATTPGPSGF